MDSAAAAKRIRSALRSAQRDGRINPDLKISVRSSGFAGGSEVRVRIAGCTGMDHEDVGRLVDDVETIASELGVYTGASVGFFFDVSTDLF